jgi:pimeloyl-ACP methyl ester carboxylesterase
MKPNWWDPINPKRDAIPILLLHGSSFNESEWIIGRQFLKKTHYGSVFSLSYDGFSSNDLAKGIDDYAQGKVRDKILHIKQLTGQDRLILIGHSMGGMIAGYYVENCAVRDGIQVEHVITIASPWRGSPIIDRLIKSQNSPKRYKQMSVASPSRQKLVAQALRSERISTRKYFSIGSETDLLVPDRVSILTEDPRRQCLFSYLGHYSIIASPRV